MSLPSISVIFLSDHPEPYVREALRSVLAQDLREYEVVIGDDASTDATRRILEEEAASHAGRVHVVVLPPAPNSGVIGNFNRCVASATGDVLVVAAGDDVSHPGRLRRVAEFFAGHPRCAAHYSNARVIDAVGAVVRASWADITDTPSLFRFDPVCRHLYQGVRFCGATASYRASLMREFGPLRPVPGGEDGPMVMRALMRGDVAVDPEILVDWRWHGRNMSHGSKPASADWRERLVRLAAWPDGQTKHLPGYLGDIAHARASGLFAGAGCDRLIALAEEHHHLASLRRDCLLPDATWARVRDAARAYWRTSASPVGKRTRMIAKALAKKMLPGRLRAALLYRASNF